MRKLLATTLVKKTEISIGESGVESQVQARTEQVDEDELLVQEARGDLSSAGRLFDKYYDKIFRYIYHATFDKTLTEDLTSNVFVAVFSHLKRFTWRNIPFRAWLYRIATNEIRMHLRRKKSAVVILERGDLAEEERAPAPDTAHPSASEALIAREEQVLLHSAMGELASKYQVVIVLKYFEDKSIAEISQILDRRQGTIKSQLHRGLARLQEIMVRRGVFREEAGVSDD